MAQINVDENVRKYETFINDVLRDDLRRIDTRLQEVNAEISDLIQQKHTLKIVCDQSIHPNGFKTQVNLGCNFFMEATVPDTSNLLMNIGLNHFVEFSIQEANKYLDVRIKAFEKKADELRDQGAKTKAHIKLMLFHISELQSKEVVKMSKQER